MMSYLRRAVGKPADIVIIDDETKYTVDVESFKSKAKNSPYDGWELFGKPEYTIVSGDIKVKEGTLI